jgi:hypothetical protein
LVMGGRGRGQPPIPVQCREGSGRHRQQRPGEQSPPALGGSLLPPPSATLLSRSNRSSPPSGAMIK